MNPEQALDAPTYIRFFRKLKATSPSSAVDPNNFINKTLIFTKLLDRKIIRKTLHDKYYLDETAVKEVDERKRIIFILALILFFSLTVLSVLVADYYSGGEILHMKK